jgi:7-cyano-7-deazaguanine reductase
MATSRKSSTPPPNLTLLGNPAAGVPSSPADAPIEVFPNPHPSRHYNIRIDCPDFTSLCPVTGQPDFAELTLEYIPNRSCIETKSLKLHLAAYRNVRAFNEDVINRLLQTLVTACQPRRMQLIGRFAARGGLALTVTAHHPRPLSRP